jgi:hypothetical protein
MIALAIIARLKFDEWRKRAITEAGKSLGFRRLTEGEVLSVVLVPLINTPNRKYLIILRGVLEGNAAAFFDLFCGAGKDWFYQSAVMISNPRVTMPRFQLRTPRWSRALSQRTCGEVFKIAGREGDMGSLRLSADDSEWARQTFSEASSQFFQKVLDGKWTIEGFQHSLVIYRWGEKIPPKRLKEYLMQTAELSTEVFTLCS